MPKVFVEWVNDNKSRWQANGKAAPFFIRDNYQQGDVDKGLDTRITAAIEEAKLAAATAKAKAKPATPKPITDYDTDVEDLRRRAYRWELDLTTMEQIRNEGKDKKALLAEIKALQKQIKERAKLEDEAEYRNRIAIINAGMPIKGLVKINPNDAHLADLQSRMADLDAQRRGILTSGRPYTQQIAEFNAMLPELQKLQADVEQAKKAAVDVELSKFDSDIDALRAEATMYDLDLAEIERLRTTGTDAYDIKKLQAEIKKSQKERKEREKRWNEKIKELKDAIKELQSIEAAFLSASPTADEKTAYQNAVKEAQQALIDNAIATGNTYTTSTNSLDIATTKAQQAKAEADKVMSKATATSAAAKKEPVYIGNKTPQKAEVQAVKLQKQIDDLINKGYSRRDAVEAVAIENIQKTNGLTKAEAEEEYRAVQSYTGSYYSDIREAQRDAAAGRPYSKKYFEKGEQLEKFIKESPKWQKTTYRGVAMPEAVFLKYSVGQIIDMGGATTSFATTQGVAQRFKNSNYSTINNTGVEFICDNPQNGTSVAFYSSSGEREHEILCSKKQQYRILSITYKRDNPYGGKDYIIRLEAL